MPGVLTVHQRRSNQAGALSRPAALRPEDMMSLYPPLTEGCGAPLRALCRGPRERPRKERGDAHESAPRSDSDARLVHSSVLRGSSLSLGTPQHVKPCTPAAGWRPRADSSGQNRGSRFRGGRRGAAHYSQMVPVAIRSLMSSGERRIAEDFQRGISPKLSYTPIQFVIPVCRASGKVRPMNACFEEQARTAAQSCDAPVFLGPGHARPARSGMTKER